MYSSRGYFPCSNGCAQAIIQAGIKEIVLAFIGDPKEKDVKDKYKGDAARKMFLAKGVKIRVLN